MKTVSSDNLARFKAKCDETYAEKNSLPIPTTADNGKVLGVTNGAYALQEAGGGGGGFTLSIIGTTTGFPTAFDAIVYTTSGVKQISYAVGTGSGITTTEENVFMVCFLPPVQASSYDSNSFEIKTGELYVLKGNSEIQVNISSGEN